MFLYDFLLNIWYGFLDGGIGVFTSTDAFVRLIIGAITNAIRF